MHAFGEILKAHKKPQFSFIELDCDVFTLSPIGELILGYVSFELCEVFGSSSVVLNRGCLVSSEWLQKETSEKL